MIAKEGKSGGYELARPATKISVAEIIFALEESLFFARCLVGVKCPNHYSYGCKLKLIWAKLKKNIDGELERVSLKDLI